MKCPKCQSEQVAKNGKTRLKDGSPIQKYLCAGCGKQFNRTATVALFASGNPTGAHRYRRRQNLYAKERLGIEVLNIQRLVHN